MGLYIGDDLRLSPLPLCAHTRMHIHKHEMGLWVQFTLGIFFLKNFFSFLLLSNGSRKPDNLKEITVF